MKHLRKLEPHKATGVILPTFKYLAQIILGRPPTARIKAYSKNQMGEYEVRPLRSTMDEQRLKDFFCCPVRPEPFPGPISAWKLEDEMKRYVNHTLFITLKRFIAIISQFRNVYLLEVVPSGAGVWYVFTNFRISFFPHSNHWGSVEFIGHRKCVIRMHAEYLGFAKYSYRKRFDMKFVQKKKLSHMKI